MHAPKAGSALVHAQCQCVAGPTRRPAAGRPGCQHCADPAVDGTPLRARPERSVDRPAASRGPRRRATTRARTPTQLARHRYALSKGGTAEGRVVTPPARSQEGGAEAEQDQQEGAALFTGNATHTPHTPSEQRRTHLTLPWPRHVCNSGNLPRLRQSSRDGGCAGLWTCCVRRLHATVD